VVVLQGVFRIGGVWKFYVTNFSGQILMTFADFLGLGIDGFEAFSHVLSMVFDCLKRRCAVRFYLICEVLKPLTCRVNILAKTLPGHRFFFSFFVMMVFITGSCIS